MTRSAVAYQLETSLVDRSLCKKVQCTSATTVVSIIKELLHFVIFYA